MSPVVDTTVKKTTFPQVLSREIKVDPNLDKEDLWHGNKSAFGVNDSDVIVISSDSESENNPRVKKEVVRLKLEEPTVRAKPRGKVRNRAIPVANTNPASKEAFDRGSFFQESETVWTDSEITSFVIEGDHRALGYPLHFPYPKSCYRIYS